MPIRIARAERQFATRRIVRIVLALDQCGDAIEIEAGEESR